MSYDEQNNDDDDGSVWTSNSDLFMTIAIVFLIMFIFSLIMAGVNAFKSKASKAETEDLIEAKVPPKDAERNAKNLELVQNTY